jgi:ribonuclease Z
VYRLLQHGHVPLDVSRLLLTHLHYDHCVDFVQLVLSRWFEGRAGGQNLMAYGPPGTPAMAEQLFGADGVYGPDLATRPASPTMDWQSAIPDVREVSHGDVFGERDWTVRVAEVRHYQPHLTPLAYRFEHDGISIVFGGDSGPSDALVELARGADVLLHMCHDVTGTDRDEFVAGHIDAARVALEAEVGALVLVHLPDAVRSPAVAERVIHDVSQIYGGTVILGSDLMVVPLPER